MTCGRASLFSIARVLHRKEIVDASCNKQSQQKRRNSMALAPIYRHKPLVPWRIAADAGIRKYSHGFTPLITMLTQGLAEEFQSHCTISAHRPQLSQLCYFCRRYAC